MIHQIDENTRVKLKFHIPALSTALCLQRKKWYGWKTDVWIYPSVVEDMDIDYIINHLKRHEIYKNRSQKTIGKNLMSNNTNK